MGIGVSSLVVLAAVVLAVAVGIAIVVLAVVPLGRLVWGLIVRVAVFVAAEVGDLLRVAGAIVTAVVFVPLAAANVVIGRWSAASHYGRALQTELVAMGGGLYRIVIGHPARLLGLGAFTEGIERRVPMAMAGAPGADSPGGLMSPAGRGKSALFEGYEIIGSLPSGGSGGRLYIARPTAQKAAGLARQGVSSVDRVVIKVFSLRDGSTLPQIVRENRALPAARRMGLILEHDLNEERFFYITRYVPGEPLGVVTQRMHAADGATLSTENVRRSVGFAADLLSTLSVYHAGGLWHKDVKPDNVIIADGRAHLVDFGLITPLRSTLTLTTHGTEYFRDPEMVRLALRGVKVHEVDGARFDLYAVGAVLFSVLENSFPAHGGLSQITRRCPEGVRWVVRRAMADYDKRYGTADQMLADVRALLAAPDMFAVRPADLPSMVGGGVPGMADLADGAAAHAAHSPATVHPWEADAPRPDGVRAVHGPGGAASVRPDQPWGQPAVDRSPRSSELPAPGLRMSGWWTGRYEVAPRQSPIGPPGVIGPSVPIRPATTVIHEYGFIRPEVPVSGPPVVPGRGTAAQQLVRAKARVDAKRERAARRSEGVRGAFEPAGVNTGVVLAVVVAGGLVVLTAVGVGGYAISGRRGGGGGGAAAWAVPNVVELAPTDSSWLVGTHDADVHGQDGQLKRSTHTVKGRSDTRVMVMMDGASLSDDAKETLDRQLDGLRGLGLTVLGDGATSEVLASDGVALGEDGLAKATPALDGESEEDLLVELRAQVGVAPFGSIAARTLLLAWLDQRREVAMVAWAGRSPDGEVGLWMVAARDREDALLNAAAVVDPLNRGQSTVQSAPR